jgi:hypothetical protein
LPGVKSDQTQPLPLAPQPGEFQADLSPARITLPQPEIDGSMCLVSLKISFQIIRMTVYAKASPRKWAFTWRLVLNMDLPDL